MVTDKFMVLRCFAWATRAPSLLHAHGIAKSQIYNVQGRDLYSSVGIDTLRGRCVQVPTEQPNKG